ncbi:MAG: type II secretion system minor pseudopilin GspJ [Gammaproteobacteria bacterium]|nr:type II secretion system minor pseudopilin GspJ [Gammaproteobacteria bacterium]MDH4314766.1 type II secretion system minor pseudopilin GspJ [Gammaproteobacteria bacterium]MDH5214668.1 type II secretion system minor pseudopilin GspJ [Gammaproteobacteria bacterium]
MKRHVKVISAFTLIEVLVSLAVFAILAALAYGVLNQTLANAEMLSERMNRLQAVQRTMRILSEDLFQLTPRPVRLELGDDFGAAIQTSLVTGYALELTRGGWNNPLAMPRGTLQRAAYRMEEDQLVRYHWNVLDRTFSNELVGVTLLDGVESIVFRFMRDNGEWTDQWPPQGASGPNILRQRPRAVEIILSLQGEGTMTRLIEVAP